MYYIFNGEYFGLTDFFLGLFSPIINSEFVLLFTYWIVFSHLFLSYLLLLERKKKQQFISIGFLLHGGIAFFMGLWSFSLVMFGALVLYIAEFNLNIKTSWRIKHYLKKLTTTSPQY
jgi:hypothetical protein